MEPLHTFLAITCKHCQAMLLRLGLSANKDIVVCPVCLRAGGFDDVLEEGAELTEGYDFTDETRSLVRRLWAEHTAH